MHCVSLRWMTMSSSPTTTEWACLMDLNTLQECPYNLWRIARPREDEIPIQSANTCGLENSFCLHVHTEGSVAGTVCKSCGMVLSTSNTLLDVRAPVSVKNSEPSCITGTEQARVEWDQQIRKVIDQPTEVVQHAWPCRHLRIQGDHMHRGYLPACIRRPGIGVREQSPRIGAGLSLVLEPPAAWIEPIQ